MFSRPRDSTATKFDTDKRRSPRSTNNITTRNGEMKGSKYKRRAKRRRRHVGPHDEGGLQRLISTGNFLSVQMSVYSSLVFLEESPCLRGPIYKSLSLSSDFKSLSLSSRLKSLISSLVCSFAYRPMADAALCERTVCNDNEIIFQFTKVIFESAPLNNT